ncbi:hypothetical protein C6502_11470 [Candidatus Poribacteria bacterium]|nr:MAG: hypothetical protein C6502_11470 [Candidatus Poribacteria bacterium]
MSFNYAEVTETVIKAFYTVYDALGYGFLEKVYQNAAASKTIDLNKILQSVFICVYLRPI